MLESIPRVNLAFLPTPIHRMRNLGESLGIDQLWIKRDDITGLGFGGNKTRKLEYALGAAVEQDCDTVVTVGAVQSNSCRQTAEAAAACGLRCILLLGGHEPSVYTGNLLLDKYLGAELKFFPSENIFSLNDRLEDVMNTLTEFGLKPFAIPAGVATPTGTLGYVQAMYELKTQLELMPKEPDKIIVSCGTGGTLAGMVTGAELAGIHSEIVGVSALDQTSKMSARVDELISRMKKEYPDIIPDFVPNITIDDRFLGKGYGEFDDSLKSAIEMFAKMEGIFLDPVYTAKGGLALLTMALGGEIDSDETILFWHTGGQIALFTQNEELHRGTK